MPDVRPFVNGEYRPEPVLLGECCDALPSGGSVASMMCPKPTEEACMQDFDLIRDSSRSICHCYGPAVGQQPAECACVDAAGEGASAEYQFTCCDIGARPSPTCCEDGKDIPYPDGKAVPMVHEGGTSRHGSAAGADRLDHDRVPARGRRPRALDAIARRARCATPLEGGGLPPRIVRRRPILRRARRRVLALAARAALRILRVQPAPAAGVRRRRAGGPCSHVQHR